MDIVDACNYTTDGSTIKMWLKKPVPVFGSEIRIYLYTGFFLPLSKQISMFNPYVGDSTTLARFKGLGNTEKLPHQVILVLEDKNGESFNNPSDTTIPFVKFMIETIHIEDQCEKNINEA